MAAPTPNSPANTRTATLIPEPPTTHAPTPESKSVQPASVTPMPTITAATLTASSTKPERGVPRTTGRPISILPGVVAELKSSAAHAPGATGDRRIPWQPDLEAPGDRQRKADDD